jgi:hypothetical protein
MDGNLNLDPEEVEVRWFGYGGLKATTVLEDSQYLMELWHFRPNIVAVILGSNDLDENSCPTAKFVADTMTRVLWSIRGELGVEKIVVCPLFQRRHPHRQTYNTDLVEVNRLLAVLRDSAELPIILMRQVNPAGDFTDRYHLGSRALALLSVSCKRAVSRAIRELPDQN